MRTTQCIGIHLKPSHGPPFIICTARRLESQSHWVDGRHACLPTVCTMVATGLLVGASFLSLPLIPISSLTIPLFCVLINVSWC